MMRPVSPVALAVAGMASCRRCLRKCLRACFLASAMVCALFKAHAEPAAATDVQLREQQRARIQAERARIEAKFAAELAECQQRFVVTACVDGARQRRREALAAPRTEALTLDDLERRERAEARRVAIEAKQREAAARVEPAASVPAGRVRPEAPATASPPRPSDPAAAASAAAAQAQQRAAAARERQAEIQATQARIRARQAERLRDGKVAAPLPVPAASR